jgi:predicted DNA-binding transcriptional regulator YafY
VPKSSRKLVSDLIRNEEFHYVELRHKRSFNDTIWEIGKAIHGFHCIEIEYRKLKGKEMVRRKLQPLAVMFSEYYFYLVAFIDDKKLREDLGILEGAFPAIYRIDRIRSLRVLDETFQIPYQNRFEEGEFRKRIQFMYGGRLQKVVFRYQGTSIEAVLDRLPTAEILSEEDGIYTVSAEVYGDGIDMWLHSQMDALEVVKPESLREKMKHSLQEMLKHYE